MQRLLSKFIPTSNVIALRDYYSAHVPVPKRSWLPRTSSAEGSEDLADVALSLLGRLDRKRRLEEASHLWNDPRVNSNRASIQGLKSSCGFGSESDSRFLQDMASLCDEYKQKHPELERWLDIRKALLNPIKEPDESFKSQFRLTRNHVLELGQHVVRYADAQEFSQIQGTITKQFQEGLNICGLAAMKILSKEGVGGMYNANFMIPVAGRPTAMGELLETTYARENYLRANELWAPLPDPEISLIIIGESEGSYNLGFWVPVLKEDISPLPGAPKCFVEMCGDSVHKDDLPDLSALGYPSSIDLQWRSYLGSVLPEASFVSIPVKLPVTAGASRDVPVGVVNVNAIPGADDLWIKSYDPDSLRSLENTIEGVGEVLFRSYTDVCYKSNGLPRPKTGIARYDNLGRSDFLPQGK